MVTVPLMTPASTPLDEPTAATDGALLVHVPPPAASVSVVVAPTQTRSEPPIGAGPEFTVTPRVA